MIGIDTNLLARFLLKDDPVQHRRAVAVLASDEVVFVPITVLLELAWVLRAREATREEILASLRGILALPRVRLQHEQAVRTALGWVEAGLDVADAFHLALSAKASRFLTFDAVLARRAAKLGAQPPAAAP
ncbi:MAG: type II toxin-antitoxin system VapC family toxin [Betaproteobacteria bacterium]|nr:type II toxin-antitoxin system VapC family toxin [Betaproteobacteria bacterium]